jgi:hypothetical protein
MKRRALAAGAALAVALLLAVAVLLIGLPARVRGDLVTFAARTLGHDVEIGALAWRLRPALQLRGDEIVVRGPAADDAPPLLRLESFILETEAGLLLSSPRRVRRMSAAGLQVHLPPHRGEGRPEEPAPNAAGTSPVRSAPRIEAGSPGPLIVDELTVTNARVEIASSDPDRPPRVFQIHDLLLTGLAADRPWAFEAALINPQPEGDVATRGTIGPWNRSAPRLTPIEGRYRFTGGRLEAFRGIGGQLDAEGRFEGRLDDLAVTGEADIPDFFVEPARQPVRLRASYEVTIADRAADIGLETVEVALDGTWLSATGEIVRRTDAGGRVIVLDVSAPEARVEDLLKFAVAAAEPPLTGPTRFAARLEIPPDERRVIERLQVDGEFDIQEARFANLNIQRTLERLSRLTRGSAAGEDGSSVVSRLRGRFTMRDGIVRFSSLAFGVPGTTVQLTGTYDIEREEIDLLGRLLIDRAPSAAVPGRAGEWLSRAERLWTGGRPGIVVPIRIAGERTRPAFRIDPEALGQNWRQILQGLPGPG